MKVTAFLLLSVLLISANCLQTYHFHHGDQLLHAMQEGKGQTFIIMIANDESNDKKLQLTNARVADGLYHNVLTTPAPTDAEGKPTADPTENDVTWARVNADDHERNDHLLHRLKIDSASLEEWPTVVVVKDGIGYSLHGPTTVRHAKRHVDDFAAAQ
mmetsp:Transcript_14792/g.16498  ORF Transcript_14792/g.16498 Transcript_14792/m.16498 type:complete len:158 (+) Transcript_14792:36-509(+)